VDLERHTRRFAHLYDPAPEVSGVLLAQLQGRDYVNATLAVQPPRASMLRAVLGTVEVYVDSSTVRLAVQLLSASGNVRVLRSGLSLQLNVVNGGQTSSTFCPTPGVPDPAAFYLVSCELESLPTGWFSASTSAEVVLVLRYDESVIVTQQVGVLQVQQQPRWFGAGLIDVLPAARPSRPAGMFVAMPASPVYAGDAFDVVVYAHTGGFALETWWALVDIRSDALEYVAHEGSPAFNGVIYSAQLLANGTFTRLSFNVVGTKAATEEADVRGGAVPLLTSLCEHLSR